jgi:conjugal transfer pilus assembly protein TraD
MEEEADLFPAQLLGMLPNLEYIAKISGGKIVKGRLPILTEK